MDFYSIPLPPKGTGKLNNMGIEILAPSESLFGIHQHLIQLEILFIMEPVKHIHRQQQRQVTL